MLEKKIVGVPIRWGLIGGLALFIVLILTTIGGCVAYSNAVATGAASANVIRRELDAKITDQEQNLSKLRTTLNASMDKLDQHERTIVALRNDTDKLTKQVSALETDRTRLQAQVLLAKAASKIVRAIMHLSADSPGLAKRDLATAIETLDQALPLATTDQRNAIGEIRKSLAELRESIEAKAYPISTLEILGDKIDDLIGK